VFEGAQVRRTGRARVHVRSQRAQLPQHARAAGRGPFQDHGDELLSARRPYGQGGSTAPIEEFQGTGDQKSHSGRGKEGGLGDGR
jgi:hypothetical protein